MEDDMQIEPDYVGAPDPAVTARQIIDAMLVRDPVPAVGHAVHRRSDGRPILTIAVAIGEHPAGALRDTAAALARTYPESLLPEFSPDELPTPSQGDPQQP